MNDRIMKLAYMAAGNMLSYDAEGDFWGNVMVVYDDGIGGISNSWQLEKIDE